MATPPPRRSNQVRIVVACLIGLAAAALVLYQCRSPGESGDQSTTPQTRSGDTTAGGGSFRPSATASPSFPDLASWVEGQVITKDGKPVAKATVQLTRQPLTDEGAQVETDQAGKFRFDGVMAGRYHVQAFNNRQAGGPNEIIVQPGATSVVIVVQSAIVIAIEVVASDTGAPIPGARGTLMVSGTQGAIGRRHAVADAQGVLRFPAVPLGNHHVEVEADGYARGAKLVSWLEYVGEDWTGRIPLRPGKPIRGRVVDEHGGPVAGAMVRTISAPIDDTKLPSGELLNVGEVTATIDPLLSSVPTDREGKFAVNVPVGRSVILVAEHPDFPIGQVTAAPGDLDITLVVTRGSRFEGEVVDGNGVAVPGAIVSLEPWGGRQVATGLDGRFSMSEIEAGTDGMFLYASTSTARSSPTYAKAGEHVVLVVEHEATITGTVLGEDGTPIAAAIVQYVRTGGGDKPDEEEISARQKPAAIVRPPVIQGEVLSEADGGFSMHGLAPGKYAIQAFLRETAHNRISIPAGTHAEVMAGTQNVELKFPGATKIRGRVMDTNGRPIPQFTIALTDLSPPVALGDPEGAFELGPFYLVAIPQTARIEAPGYLPLDAPLTGLAAGVTVDLGELRLAPGFKIEGTLRSPAGNAIPGGFIHVWNAAGEQIDTTRSDAEGKYQLVLPAGTSARIQAFLPGVGGSREVSVKANATVPLILPEYGKLTVTTALANGTVHATRTDEPIGAVFSWPIPITGAGKYSGQVTAGRYEVVLTGPDGVGVVKTGEVDVRFGATATLQLE